MIYLVAWREHSSSGLFWKVPGILIIVGVDLDRETPVKYTGNSPLAIGYAAGVFVL